MLNILKRMYVNSEQKRYKIVQYRFTPTTLDRTGDLLFETNRIKEARGQIKQHFNSHIEMMIKHDLVWSDFEVEIEPDYASIVCFENNEMVYKYIVKIEIENV